MARVPPPVPPRAGVGEAGDVADIVLRPRRAKQATSLCLAFQLVALMGGAAHLDMQAKALLVNTAHGGQWRLSCRDDFQAQHFLARPRPQRNAVGAGCRPQGPERCIRIGPAPALVPPSNLPQPVRGLDPGGADAAEHGAEEARDQGQEQGREEVPGHEKTNGLPGREIGRQHAADDLFEDERYTNTAPSHPRTAVKSAWKLG